MQKCQQFLVVTHGSPFLGGSVLVCVRCGATARRADGLAALAFPTRLPPLLHSHDQARKKQCQVGPVCRDQDNREAAEDHEDGRRSNHLVKGQLAIRPPR